MVAELPLALLAEDKSDMRDLMKAHLKKLRFEVQSVATFAEGIEALSSSVSPQLLIADQNLGDGTGEELIREWQSKREIACVLWTGDPEGAQIAASVSAVYLPKICSRRQVEEAACRALQNVVDPEVSAIVERHVSQINSDRQKRNKLPLSKETVDAMKLIVSCKPIGLREIDRLIALVIEG